MYILEGGYSGFYQSQPERCEPQGYVPMDDPRHLERRNTDLHDFRKFSRTRSFTYGETQPAPTRPVSNCPPLAFAAASAAQGRRHGPTIAEEDHEQSSSPSGGGTSGEEGHESSPCLRVPIPPLALRPVPPIFGSAKPRQFTRVGFNRVASYAGTTTAR